MALRSSPDFFRIFKPATDPDFPWTGLVFGAPILAVWYWCTDQFIVQRVLSANGIDHARRGTIFGGFLKILPVFIFVVPGIVAAGLVAAGQLELARRITNIELGADPAYMEHYTGALFLPHTDLGNFPSVAAAAARARAGERKPASE